MALRRDPELLRRLQEEVDSFLAGLRRPVLFESGVELCDLSASDWRMTVERGKLLFEAWKPGRSIARRLESVADRGRGRLRIVTRKPGSLEPSALEFRDLDAPAVSEDAPEVLGRADQVERRARFRAECLSLLANQYPGWKLERVSHRSDREHSFSAWYTRGVARRNNIAWAFLGLSDSEAPAAADSALAYALIWLDWLRGHYDSLPGLKLFLPPDAVPLAAHRATCLNPRALQIEIFEWREGQAAPRPIDLKDFGNVETRLAPCRSAKAVALRPDELCRLQPERWLESLLVRDPARIDPALSPDHVYPQVPAFSGLDRGVIDILGVRRAAFIGHSGEPIGHSRNSIGHSRESGNPPDASAGPRHRLAVIELKVEEHINLPLQALDYWLRVKWLHERGQFRSFGYFAGMDLASGPPLLYLVAPAFRFHSTTDAVIRYLDPGIEVIKVGLNQAWREGVKVLFRQNAL